MPVELDELYQQMITGDRRALSQAITLVESRHPKHRDAAVYLIEQSLPAQGRAKRIGITGVPGAGKSTLIDDMGMYLINQGQKVAVLAIDPSSQKSGGSILGDKTRMVQLAMSDQAFIRPSPAGSQLGGVAHRTYDTCILLDAAGYDVIIIETVGIGQSEVTVHSMVDFLFLCVITGAGDELQGIKRGIMELADSIIIMKADGGNFIHAVKAEQDYKNIAHIWPAHYSFWQTKVFLYSHEPKQQENNTNISLISAASDIWKSVELFWELASNYEMISTKQREQREFWLQESLRNEIQERFFSSDEIKLQMEQILGEVAESRMSTRAASQKIVDFFLLDSGKKIM